MEPLRGEVFDLLAFDHAPVAHKRDLGDAKSGLDLRKLRRQGVRIGGISWKHFDRDRMPVLVAEQANDNLQFPFFAIAIVAKGGQFVVPAFQVATGHIIQKEVDWFGLAALRKEPILYHGLDPRQPI